MSQSSPFALHMLIIGWHLALSEEEEECGLYDSCMHFSYLGLQGQPAFAFRFSRVILSVSYFAFDIV